MPQEICDLQQTGKLYHLGADCVMGDTTALDASSFNDNRRHRQRKLVNNISRPPKDELYYEDPNGSKPNVGVGKTARLGGSFFGDDDPETEDGDEDIIIVEGAESDADEEVIDAGDFVYLEEDGTVEDKDGNIIDGIALEDLEDLDADPDGDQEEELYLEEDGTVEDKFGNIIEGVKLEDLVVVEEGSDADEGLVLGGPEDANDYTIAYASQEVLSVDPPEGMAFGGIDCPCCTFCLAAASPEEETIGEDSLLSESEPETDGSGTTENAKSQEVVPETEEPVGSSECVEAIQEGIASNEYPGLVGMAGQTAKSCLQANTDKTIILVRPGIRRHFPFVDSRIILYLDTNGDVKKPPTVG